MGGRSLVGSLRGETLGLYYAIPCGSILHFMITRVEMRQRFLQ